MMGRLKPMLSVLLALVVCGAVSQTAICELSCGLASGPECHMPAASHDAAMQPMSPTFSGHCSPGMQMNSGVDTSPRFCGLHSMVCGQVSSMVVDARLGPFAHLSGSTLLSIKSMSASRFEIVTEALSQKRPPPLLLALDRTVVSLRI